jgi:hypothetical protein
MSKAIQDLIDAVETIVNHTRGGDLAFPQLTKAVVALKAESVAMAGDSYVETITRERDDWEQRAAQMKEAFEATSRQLAAAKIERDEYHAMYEGLCK